MKYITYELLSAANDWIEQTEAEQQAAEELFESRVQNYFLDLDKLRPRVSRRAWDFFRYGANENGLHDGRLLSLKVGDGLDYTPDGTAPFLLNVQRLSARIEFLNYEQNFHYLFELRGLKSLSSDLFVKDDFPAAKTLEIYTLTN